MSTRTVNQLMVPAAIIVVVLPLVIVVAAFLTSFGMQSVSRPGMGMFGPMGLVHAIGLGWTALAAVIVAGLVAALMKNSTTHA